MKFNTGNMWTKFSEKKDLFQIVTFAYKKILDIVSPYNEVKNIGSHNINIVEDEMQQMEHINGYLQHIIFQNGKKIPIKDIFG